MLRIGIDTRFLTHSAPGGYQTYVQELVAAFARIQPPHEICLLGEGGGPVDGTAGLRAVGKPIRVPFAGVAWREQWVLPRLARRLGLDLMHYPCNTMPWKPLIPSVATVHDVIAFDPQPQPLRLRGNLIRLYERFAVRRTLSSARLLITVSDAAAADLRAIGVPAGRIRSIPSAVRHAFLHPPDSESLRAFRKRYRLQGPYLLAIASADPRKNVTRAIEAFALRASRYAEMKLVVLMTSPVLRGQLESKADAERVSGRVKFLDCLPSDEMPALYGAATAFLFPSLREGFGFPPLESMACGTPVICSDRSPMNAYFVGAAMFVEPTDASAIANAIDTILTDEGTRTDLLTRGHRKVAEFSWDRTALETIRVYEEAIAEAGFEITKNERAPACRR